MTRKFSRNPLEELFQGIENLDKRVGTIERNTEKTAPFRDKDQLPPGIEGQIVLADYVPPDDA